MQIANQLDPVTQNKILKGMVYAMSGAVAVLVVALLFGVGVDKASLVAFISWLVPAGVNAYKEYVSGGQGHG